MERSRYIAALIGPVLMAISASLMINAGRVAELAAIMAASPALILITGVLAMLGGLAVVRSHNVWSGWPVIVTVFGWLAVLGGGLRILFPRQVAEITAAVGQSQAYVPFVGGVVLLLGLFLAWQGWLRRGPETPTSFEPPADRS